MKKNEDITNSIEAKSTARNRIDVSPLPDISRRGFVQSSMALASGLALACIDGADLFSAKPSFAAESDDADISATGAETKIVIVRPNQIGIVAYDVTNPDSPVAVSNCKVTVYSRYNKKTLNATTNDEGKIVLDISELAERDASGNLADPPEFNGTITVEKEGYRDVVIPLARVTGHSAFIAPTRPLDDRPYFRSLTFNEWDIQYSKPEFLYDETNTETQTIAGEIYLPDENADIGASLVIENNGNEKTVGTFDVLSKEGNIAKVQIAGDYLNNNKDYVFNEDNTPKIVFSYGTDEQKPAVLSGLASLFSESSEKKSFFEIFFSLITSKPPVTEHKEEDKVIVPSAFGPSQSIFKLPDNYIKPFGGSELSIWKPEIYGMFEFTPYGWMMFGFGFGKLLSKADNGAFMSANSWRSQPKDSIVGRYKSEIFNQFKALNAYKEQRACPNDPTKTKIASHRFVPQFKVNFQIQAFMAGEHKRKEGYWEYSLSIVAAASFTITLTFQFSILFVPLFIQVSPSLTLKAALRLGGTAENLDKMEYGAAENKTGGFGGSIALALTVGVGIAGFVSASVTGAGYISFFLNFWKNNDKKSIPRVMAGYGGNVVLTLQFFIAKYTFPIYDYNDPQAFDSDYSGSNKAKVEEALAAGDTKAATELLSEDVKELLGLNSNDTSLPGAWGEMPSFEELKKNAAIVTNAERLNSKEFELSVSLRSGKVPVTIEHVQVDPSVYGEEFAGENISNARNDFNEENPFCATIVIPDDPDFDSSDTTYVPDTSYLPVYEYTGTMHHLLQRSITPGIEGISDSEFGGVKPSIDNLLFENITSNPRLKILTTYGRTVLFRIANVDVGGGQIKSRLVYHVLVNSGTWSEPNVIEFDPQISGVSRSDMFDIDFDVVQADAYNGANHIFVNLTSAVFKNGDNSTFVESIQVQYASLITLYNSYATESPLRVDPNMTCNLIAIDEGATLVAPTISVYSDELSVVGTKDFCVIATIARRVVSEDGIGGLRRRAFFARWELDKTKDQEVFRVDHTRGEGGIYGEQTQLFPVCIDDEQYTPGVGTAAKIRRATCASVGSGMCEIYKYEGVYKDILPWSTNFQYFSGERIASSSEYQVEKIYHFGTSQGILLASCKTTGENGEETTGLYKLEFDPKNSGSIKFTHIGDTSGWVSDFVSDPDGHYLFYAENIDGKTGQEYTVNESDGSCEPTKDNIEHKYYIKATAYVQGLFTRPFVFAELDHAADSLAAACVNDEYVTFMVDDIVDMSKSISNLYDVRVPFVKCITPVSLSSVDPFCFSGEESLFSVEIRNNGNVVATGATFNFVDVSTGNIIDSKAVDFANDIVEIESVDDDENSASLSSDDLMKTTSGIYNTKTWNRSKSLFANPLVAENGTNVLTPGETEIYRVSFKIPSDWADERQVRVEVSNIQYLTPSNADSLLRAAGDVQVQTYEVEESDIPTETINVTNTADLDSSSLAAGEVRARSASGNGQNESGNVPNTTGDNANIPDNPRSDTTAIPGTGDATGKTSIALAALGAAAAGFAAYSHRRDKLERAAEGDGDSDIIEE